MNLSRPQKLKFVFAATVLAAAGIEGTVLAQHHRAPAGRDAFLNYQVDSTDELVATLKSNKTLRQRYARHFGIPEDRVIAFVKEALVPYRVPRSCVVTDHGVTKSGRIYPVKVTLKKGTRVWATRSGLPILKWACANPVAKTLPGTLMASRPRFTKAPMGAPDMELASNYPTPILAPLPDEGVSSPETITPETVDTSALTVPPALTSVSSASLPAVAAAPLGGGKGGPGIAPFVIPAIIAAAAGSGGGGHNSGPTDSTTIATTTTNVTVPTGTSNGGGTNTGGANSITGTNSGDNTGGTNTGGTNAGGTNAGGANDSGNGNGGANTGGNNTDSGNNGGGNNGGTNGGGDNTGGGNNSGGNGGGANGGSPTVPEPGTLTLFAAAGLPALAAARKRFAKK